MRCSGCGADLTQPYAVEYTDTEYVRYHAKVVFREGKVLLEEQMDGSDYLGTHEKGMPECRNCGTPVPAERESHA